MSKDKEIKRLKAERDKFEGGDELKSKKIDLLMSLLESQYKSNCFFDATLGEGLTSTAATKKADEMWDEFKIENGL